jgi:predicted N-acetyltransferase YhbS
MELVEFDDMTLDRRAELEGDEQDPFEVTGVVTLQFRPKERHVGLRDGDAGLVASAGLVLVEVEAAGERFSAVGLGGVIVRREYRRRGLGREIVEAAVAKAVTLGPTVMMLFCLPDRVGLYRRLAFTEIRDDVLVEQPDGFEVMPLRTMWRPLKSGATWPAGQPVLRGLPF